jgi:altronate dehydratase large subunit
VIGLECGGSDTTSGLVANPAIGLLTDRLVDAGGTAIFSEPVECLGAETLLIARAGSRAVARAILRAVRKYETIARRAGIDLTRTNPTPDNLRGGLTTIEEKSLGAVAKSGCRPVRGVLRYAEPPPARGVYLMDAPAAATENLTALAGGGAVAILFATGVGNPVGNPIAPTLKICANPRTCRTFRDHVDVDISACLAGRGTLAEASRTIEEALRAVLNGRPTRCEILGEMETAISRIAPSV